MNWSYCCGYIFLCTCHLLAASGWINQTRYKQGGLNGLFSLLQVASYREVEPQACEFRSRKLVSLGGFYSTFKQLIINS